MDSPATFSPDGKQICFIRDDPALHASALTYGVISNGGGNLWLQALDGSAPRPLTDFNDEVIYRFAWSPAGKALVYERGTTVNDVVLLK